MGSEKLDRRRECTDVGRSWGDGREGVRFDPLEGQPVQSSGISAEAKELIDSRTAAVKGPTLDSIDEEILKVGQDARAESFERARLVDWQSVPPKVADALLDLGYSSARERAMKVLERDSASDDSEAKPRKRSKRKSGQVVRPSNGNRLIPSCGGGRNR